MIEIVLDAEPWKRTLSDLDQRQIPFALAKAVNEVTLDVQRGERRQLRRVFTLNRPEWADRSIKIQHFATKREPWTIIGIHPPGNESRADVLSKFEDQTQKLPKSGTIAIPVSRVGIRRNKGGSVVKANRPRQIVEAGKAFIIRKKMGNVGEGLIVQRVGFGRGKKRRSSLVVLYYLARRARIKPDLKFERTANEIVNAIFPKHMDAQLSHAIRTAK